MCATNCVRLYLNRFCRKVNSIHVPHEKTTEDLDKTIHNLQLASVKKICEKARAEHYIFLFSLFYAIKASNVKLTVFRRPYTEVEIPS